MNRKRLTALVFLGLLGFAAALDIPEDQPICRLYGIIQVIATVGGIIVAAYSGLRLATTQDIAERKNSKDIITGVVVGLIIIWLAPLLVKSLVGAGDVCGW